MQDLFKYDVFLSFSSKDEPNAKMIWQELSLGGLRVFLSDEDLKESIGQGWIDKIQDALIQSKHFLLYCTTNALNSVWVKDEWQVFYQKCHINNQKMRRLIVFRGDNFDESLLPPLLGSRQRAGSVHEIITLLGGVDLEELRKEIQALKAELNVKQSRLQEFEKIVNQKDKKIESLNLQITELYHKINEITKGGFYSVTQVPVDKNKAYVTGLWSLELHPEPNISSEFRISPGAELRLLEEKKFDGKEWTKVRLADGREGWLEQFASESKTTKQGRIAYFSLLDLRVFFNAQIGKYEAIGFLMTDIYIGKDLKGFEGNVETVGFKDNNYNNIQINNSLIQKIVIDRSKQGSAVEISTANSNYKGEFRCVLEGSSRKGPYLITSKPFVSITDITNEIDLSTVEKMILTRVDTLAFSVPE